MIKVFEPLSADVGQVFEQPSQATKDITEALTDPERIREILSSYSQEDFQKLLAGEVENMDERTKRTMIERAGSVSNFLKAVMSRMAVRLVADKVIKDYGPAALAALGFGASAGVGSAIADRMDLLGNLTPEQQDIFAPFLEHMSTAHTSLIADAIDPTDAVDAGHGILDWLGDLLS